MATIKYFIQGKSKETPIYIRFSISRGNTPKRKTGFVINPNDWSKSTHLPKQNSAYNKNLITDLQKLKTYIHSEYNIDYSKGFTINGDWLSDKIDKHFNQGKQKTDLNIITEYIHHYLSTAHLRKNSKGGIGLGKSRINDYKRLAGIISEFQGGTPLLISDINLGFKDKFLKWMTETKNYSIGYTGRMLGNLKSICLDAETNDIRTNKQLSKVSGFRTKNEFVIYLTENEIEQITNTKISLPYLQNAKKWLLLGCNIGQRGSDLLKINESNFVTRNNLKVIELVQQKTGKSVTIPVLPNTQKIIENGLPHKISLQRFNDYIKEVCKLSNIKTSTRGKKLNPTTKRHEEGIYEKWELVSSHICRRSFATNLYGKLPTPLIMQITAHSSEKTFYGYIGKNSFDFAQQIADYFTLQSPQKENQSNLTLIHKSI
ncbi:tyrosine-type recombinase/integrase [Neotamlana sedimentorum]|uniref:tyrosine-type recombinase/integrase n=1 Tax=Neotamlana sedimentorum TaxID=1435349 RepID=UPI0005CC25A4|nr:tyrosine-type recombinase/integrase [Tamlana sedimentorum]